jgi:ketosteroid isomerase-like protein
LLLETIVEREFTRRRIEPMKLSSRPHLVSALLSILFLPPALANESLATYRAGHVQAVLAESVDRVMGPHAENVRLIPPYHGTVFGRANVRAYYAAFFARFEVRKYQREVVKVFDLGPRLVEIGRLTMALTLPNDPRVHEIRGSYMDIWEQAGDKPTNLITHFWNTDKYPEIGSELKFASVPNVRTALEAHVPIKDHLSFELAALNKLHEVAITQGDDKVWAQFFSDDAVLLATHHGLVQGKPAIEAYLAGHVKEMPIFEKLDIRNDAIDVAGRYIIEYASHVANWRNGDSSGVNTGKNIRLWRREPGGSLKMFCGIGTYD